MSNTWLRFGLAPLLAVACALMPRLASAQVLTVSAASSLTEAFREIGPRFEAEHPGVRIRFNFAASGLLMQQILQGAPVDVFASADEASLDRGIQAGAIDPATQRPVAGNALVLVVPLQVGPALSTVADLARADVRRVAVGKPATVPVGRYTRQALQAAGLWAIVEPKVIQADSVRQVLDYVARGEVDAGFVYRTDAQQMSRRVRQLATVTGHEPIRYPAAVATDSRHPALARSFVDFLSGPAAQSILGRHGFTAP